jgi:hypothetical protein
MQACLGLLLQAGACTFLGLKDRALPRRAEAWLNCACLLLLGSWSMVYALWWPSRELADRFAGAGILAAGGGLLVWQSLALRLRGLLYLALLAFAAAGYLARWSMVELDFLPAHSSGAGAMSLTLLFCIAVLVLERSPQQDWRKEFRIEPDTEQPPLALLWHFRLGRPGIDSLAEVSGAPLRLTAGVLWGLGLAHILMRLVEGLIGVSWVWAVFAGALAAPMLAGFFRLTFWPPIVALLGLGTLWGTLRQIGAVDPRWFPVMAIAYAWLAWRVVLNLPAQHWVRRLGKILALAPDDPELPLERSVHYIASLIVVAGLIQAVYFGATGVDPRIPLLALALAAGFFLAAGWHYRLHTHGYLVLFLILLAMIGVAKHYDATIAGIAGAMIGLGWTFQALSWHLGRGLENRLAGFEDSLFRKPLSRFALLLNAGAGLSLFAHETMTWGVIAGLGLAAFGLLHANRSLRWPLLNPAAILFIALDLLWLEFLASHGEVEFDPWAEDVGIGLGLLTLALTLLARRRAGAYAADLRLAAYALMGFLGLHLIDFFQRTDIGVASTLSLFALLDLSLIASPAFGQGSRWLPLRMHGGVLAGFCAGLALALKPGGLPGFSPVALMALFDLGLAAADLLLARRARGQALAEAGRAALGWWLKLGLLGLPLALWLAFSLNALVLAAAAAAALSFWLGHRSRSLAWWSVSFLLAVLCLHLWPFLLPDWGSRFFDALFWTVTVGPSYAALQMAVLSILAWLPIRRCEAAGDDWSGQIGARLAKWRALCLALGVFELLICFGFGALPMILDGEAIDALTAASVLGAGLLLLGQGVYGLWDRQNSFGVYRWAVFALGLLVYARMLWRGLALPDGIDAVPLIAVSVGLLGLQRRTASVPLLRIVMALPLLILLTVGFGQWGLNSAPATLALWFLCAWYAMIGQVSGSKWPAILVLLFFNGGAYLWIPAWFQSASLVQVCVAPAALSVLLMERLHRRELKAGIAHSVRLAATSALYVSAGWDIFKGEGFGVFALGIGLSLLGVLVGIVLRVRAFMYFGVCFLVIVVGQALFEHYPDAQHQRQRAFLLMGLGTAIIACMIGFSLKRERILRQLRLARADLAEWE